MKISYILKNFTFLKNLIYYNKGYNHLKKLLKSAKRNEIINKTIVFNTVKSLREYIDREFFLGKLLALNGANVIMLLDDGLLKSWQEDFNKRNSKIYVFCYKRLIKKALRIYRDKNLRIIYYSKILDENKVTNTNLSDLKNHALSSTIVHFKNSVLDFNNPEVKKCYELHYKNSIISRSIGEFILNNINPDYFVTSHGIYSYWGPAYDFLREHGVKCLIYAMNHSHSADPQDIYFTYSKAQTLSRCKFWQDFKPQPVTSEMEKKVRALFNLRINHNTKDTKLYYDGDLCSYKINKNDGYKFHIAIFPSLIWDGDIAERHLAFSSILDWLISTIDFLKNKLDIKIYLKFHPAEVSISKDSAKIQDLIKDYLKSNEINNLILIPAETKIDTYEFLKSGVNFGICYDGILALEMPYLKIPVLLGGVKGRFSVENGNFTITSKDEYFNYLENLDKIIKDFHTNYGEYYKNIIRYAYWYLFENVIKLPILSKKHRKMIDLLQLTRENLQLDEKILKIFN